MRKRIRRQERKIKRALTMSLLGFSLVIVLMVGTTYAWFSNSVESGTNTIRTAGFEVRLEYSTTSATTGYANLTSTAVLFDDVVLRPGMDTGVKYIRVTNNNDYAVKASVSLGAVTTQGGTNEMELYAASGVNSDKTLGDLTKVGTTLAAATLLDNVEIAAGGSQIIALAVKLPDDATAGGVTNTFTITVGATQETE